MKTIERGYYNVKFYNHEKDHPMFFNGINFIGIIGELYPNDEIESYEKILSSDRETALEEAVKFHKQVAEEAINEQARLLLENEKLRETNQELTNAFSAIQHERNKNELH